MVPAVKMKCFMTFSKFTKGGPWRFLVQFLLSWFQSELKGVISWIQGGKEFILQ